MPHFEHLKGYPTIRYPASRLQAATCYLGPIAFLVGLLGLTSCNNQDSASINSKIADTNLVLTPATNAAPVSLPAPETANTLVASAPTPPSLTPEMQALHDAFALDSQGKLDAALEKVNSVLQTDPKKLEALTIRGDIYSKQKLWDQARKDYEAVLQIDNQNIVAKFNLNELKFMQKAYDDARPGFVALTKDPELGDLATFKVFLCDLLAGHEDVAQKEFNDFNKVGSNASFYFANVAWYTIHKQPEDARSWLASATRIYPPEKIYLYTSSLRDLGYLPLPPPPAPAN